MSLRLLPPTLQKLDLYISIEIIDEPAWGRLTSLHSLLLQWPWVQTPSHYQGCGLARLPALQDLSIDRGPPSNSAHATDRLLGNSFSSPHLTTLHFEIDPFEGKLDLCKLPSLMSFVSYASNTLPRWLKGRKFLLSCGVYQCSAENYMFESLDERGEIKW